MPWQPVRLQKKKAEAEAAGEAAPAAEGAEASSSDTAAAEAEVKEILAEATAAAAKEEEAEKAEASSSGIKVGHLAVVVQAWVGWLGSERPWVRLRIGLQLRQQAGWAGARPVSLLSCAAAAFRMPPTLRASTVQPTSHVRLPPPAPAVTGEGRDRGGGARGRRARG